MTNDPELKAMSEVYDALSNLDGATQRRVVDWVLGKLQSSPSGGAQRTGAKRGPKPGKKRGRKPGTAAKKTGAKRGPKPGRKRGRPAGSTTSAAKTGKRGRPKGSAKKSSAKSTGRRRGRPRKNADSQSGSNA